MNTTPTIIYLLGIIDGYNRQQVKRNLIDLMAMSEDQAEQALAACSVRITQKINSQELNYHLHKFHACGLVVSLTPQPPPAATVDQGYSGIPGADGATVRVIPVEFHGNGKEYFRIWIVNLVLSILTLGIYSAWAKVRRKQYFYGNTRIDGSAFEYLADPKKILKGRLLLFGALLLYNMTANFTPLLNILYIFILAFCLPWVIIRAHRFNACNSAFRNIRFSFNANYGQAARVYIWWNFLSAITLGLVYPIAYCKQRRLIVDHHRFGTRSFAFGANNKDYYKIIGMSVLLGSMIMTIIGFVSGIICLPYLNDQQALLTFLPSIMSFNIILTYVAIYFVVLTYFSVKAINLLYNTTWLGRHSFHADLKFKSYFWLILTNALATVFTLGLFHPWAAVRTHRYLAEHIHVLIQGSLEDFVAAEQESVSALGDSAADLMDFDLGL